MAKLKFKIRKKSKKNNKNIDIINDNIKKYNEELREDDDLIVENLSEDLDLKDGIVDDIVEKKPTSRKKKRKMRFKNPLVKIIKKL